MKTTKNVSVLEVPGLVKLNDYGLIFARYEELKKISKSLQHSHENACNYGLTPRQQKRGDNLVKKARELAADLGLEGYE